MVTGKRLEKIGFIILIFISFLIRVYLIFNTDPSGDEIWGFFESKSSFRQIWFTSFTDNHPPLYFILIKVISVLLNIDFNITDLRVLALVFGLSSILALYLLVKNFFNTRVLGSVLFLGLFAPVSIWMSVTARYYSLLALLSLISFYLYLDYLKSKSNRKLLWIAVVLIVGMYMHYYFVFLLFAYAVHGFYKYKKLRKKWFIILSIILISYVPALYYFFTSPKFRVFIVGDSIFKLPASLLVHVTSFPALIYIYQYELNFYHLLLISGLFFILILILAKGFTSLKREHKVLFGSLTLIPISLLLLLTFLVKPVLGVSSLSIFSYIFYIVFAYGLKKYLKIKLVFFALVILSLIPLINSYKITTYLKEPFVEVKNKIGKKDLVLHSDLYTFIAGRYYLPESKNLAANSSIYTSLIEESLGYKIISPDVILARQDKIWYFEPEFYNPEEARKTKRFLDNNLSLKEVVRFPNTSINVYLYE